MVEGRPRRGTQLIPAAEDRSETSMRLTPATLLRAARRAALPAALLSYLAFPASAGKAPTDLLGLYPDMSDADAQHRLQRLGEVVRGEDRAKQTWKLRDP